MTIARPTCPACGEVELPVTAIELHPRRVGGARYVFKCPGCGEAVDKRADPQVVMVLRSVGVPVVDALTEEEIEAFRRSMNARSDIVELAKREGNLRPI